MTITVWQVEFRQTIFEPWQPMLFRFCNRGEAEVQAERWTNQGYLARVVRREVAA